MWHASIRSKSAKRCIKLLPLLLGLAGCGDPQGRLPLSGTVSLKGKPLPTGIISFDSAEPQTSAFSSGSTIKDGAFTVPAAKGLPPGKYVARISAQSAPFRVPGRPAGNPPETKELIPETYNTQSKEIIEMKRGGENSFVFDIP